MQYTIHQYRITIALTPALQEKILLVKKDFSTRFDAEMQTKGGLDIGIIHFQQYAMTESKIVHRLTLLANTIRPFQLSVQGFGSLPTHTIYFNIESKPELKAISKQLQAMRSLLTIDKEHKPHFIDNPNLPLAKRLLPWQYEQGWLAMQHEVFGGKCMVEQIQLCRKKEGASFYSTIQTIDLMGKPVQQIIQGNLFAA